MNRSLSTCCFFGHRKIVETDKIANKLNDEFGMRSAEIVLLITYFVEEMSHGK